jgi:hypothetical protein
MEDNENKYYPKHTSFLLKAAKWTVISMCISFFITFGIQLSYFSAKSIPVMSWWWVFAPIWIPCVLFVIAFIAVISIIIMLTINDVKHS